MARITIDVSINLKGTLQCFDGHNFLGTTLGQHLPLMHHNDLLRVTRRKVNIVKDHHHGLSLCHIKPLQQFHDF